MLCVEVRLREFEPPKTLPNIQKVRDQYRRPFNVGGQTLVDGWHRLAHSAEGVSRLTEREQEEFAYIGSNGANGEVVWRVHHPGPVS